MYICDYTQKQGQPSVVDVVQSYVDEALSPISQALELLNGDLQRFRADLENVTLLVNTQDSTPYIPVGMLAGEFVDLASRPPPLMLFQTWKDRWKKDSMLKQSR